MSGRDALAAAVVCAAVLATAPFGHGGRDAAVLAAHHTLLAVALLAVAWRTPEALRRHRLLLAALASFAVYSYLLSPYRYSTVLFLADLAAAGTLFWLAALAAGHPRGPTLVLGGLVAGFAFVLAAGLAEKVAAEPVRGLFANPNHAGSLAACAGAVALALATRQAPRTGSRWVGLATAAAAIGFVFLAASKGATLALAAAYVSVLLARRRPRLVLLLGAALVLGAVLPTPLAARLAAGRSGDVYAYERVGIWSNGWRLAVDHALKGGAGVGAYEKVAHRYNFPVAAGVSRFGKVANVAHCEYLELLAEASLPGLLLLLVPGFVALRRAVAGLAAGGARADVALAALAGSVALLVQALVESNLHSPANLYALAVLFGLARPPVVPGAGEAAAERAAAFRVGLVAVVALLWWGGVALPWSADRAYQRHARSGDPAELERAIARAPGHAGYRVAAGRAAEDEFERAPSLPAYQRARSDYALAARLDPLEPRHPARLARLAHLGFLRRYPALELAEQSLRDYAAAIRLDPHNPFLEVDRARLLHVLGRAGEARAALERAVTLEPNCRIGHELLLAAAREAGDEAARAAAEEAIRRIDELRLRRGGLGSAYERRLLGGGEPEGVPAPPSR